MNSTQTIGVIGAGTMGTGIAQVCAVARLPVEAATEDETLKLEILSRADAAAARDAIVATNTSSISITKLGEATGRSERFVGLHVDEAMKLGGNHPIGPLALCDLIGIDSVLAVMEVFHREFKDPKYQPAPLLTQMVAAGHLGRKSGHGFYTYG